jgi:hypothetical protein
MLELTEEALRSLDPGERPVENRRHESPRSWRYLPNANSRALARAIQRHVHEAGDHLTDLPAPSLHRLDAPIEPVHCIYDFGVAVTTQGAK